jgi:hypothetical protein
MAALQPATAQLRSLNDPYAHTYILEDAYLTGIAGGLFNSLALLSDGTVRDWGGNFTGQLGDGTTTGPEICVSYCSTTPVKVSALSGVTAISGGLGESSLALLSNGTVVGWGRDNDGQLGDETQGSNNNSDVPVAAVGLSGVVGISGGSFHSLFYGLPIPGVTGVHPAIGSPGGSTQVTITGLNFTGATAVKFGSTAATSFTVNSATSITAMSPGGAAGTVDVTVTTPEGTSSTGPADRFTYVVPTVTKLKGKKSGPVTGGTTVTIIGTNFVEVSAVKFGSTAASSFTVNSATSITAVSPAEVAGMVDVTVTIPGATSGISSADRFKFRPVVTAVSPSTGSTAGGTSVTISGAGFALGTTATKFKFGATVSKSVNCTSSTECIVVAPAHAAGKVDVTAGVNKMTSAKAVADQFTYS